MAHPADTTRIPQLSGAFRFSSNVPWPRYGKHLLCIKRKIGKGDGVVVHRIHPILAIDIFPGLDNVISLRQRKKHSRLISLGDPAHILIAGAG